LTENTFADFSAQCAAIDLLEAPNGSLESLEMEISVNVIIGIEIIKSIQMEE
jgi:hypothetical protein